MEIRNLDLPQLIVALDSAQEDSNYVHIRDVRENTKYYCPCCHRLVNPRAYKRDREYHVQPHFYHSDGCCSEESRVHWLYKNWLFKEGSKFEVAGVIYSVSNVDIEELYTTSFGGYKPDITVFTKEGKKFFFEINFTNAKKEDDYFCKWSELNVDVVEVDVKKLLNSDYHGEVPVFELIYSDGICYKKDYEKRDLYASTIGARKLEWKRQDKINYKIQWEKLDWFWQELQRYKKCEIDITSVIESFTQLTFEDMSFCMEILKKIKCISLFDECKDIINQKFQDELSALDIEPYENIAFVQESSRIFYIGFQICNIDNMYYWYDSLCLRKYIQYYDLSLLKLVKNHIQNRSKTPYCFEELPKYSKIKQYSYQKILIKRNTRFYINERPCFYVDGKTESYKLDCCSFQYHFNIKDLKTLNKSEHLTRMKKPKREYQIYLLTHYIIKKINSCKNKHWHISIERSYWNNEPQCLYLHFSLEDKSDYTRIYFSDIHSKVDLYREIKSSMQKIISKYQFGTYEIDYRGRYKKYKGIRIMEVADGK